MTENVRTPGKIAAAAATAQMSVIDFLKHEIERTGSVEDAARAMGIKSSWALRRMVKTLGYEVKTRQVAEVVPIAGEHA